MPIQCHRCGAEISAGQHAAYQAQRMRLSRHPHCPQCYAALREKLYAWSWPIHLISSLFVFLTVIFVDDRDPMLWGMANIYLMIWMLPAGIVIHELGHAYAALRLGAPSVNIILGFGRKFASFRLFNLSWELRPILVGGAITLPAPMTLRKYTWVIAAGPLANALVMLIVLQFNSAQVPWLHAEFVGRFDLVGAFFWTNAALLLFSLFPCRNFSVIGPAESDGLQLWNIFTRQSSFFSLQNLDTATLTKVVAEKLAHNPDDKIFLQLRDCGALENGDLQSAAAGFAAFCDRYDLNTQERAIACNNLGYVYTVMGDPQNLAAADKLSLHALNALPGESYTRGTRGAVLILMGRYADGEQLIRESLAKAPTISGRAQNHCWLALAAAKQGQMETAQNHLAEARKIKPDCFLIPRMTQLIQP